MSVADGLSILTKTLTDSGARVTLFRRGAVPMMFAMTMTLMTITPTGTTGRVMRARRNG
jgi:hypothetical protein